MKQFSLEKYLANPSRKVVTRNGRNVKIHCTNYIGAQHIIAQIEGYDYSTSFYEDGRHSNDRDESYLDLFFALEKHEGWVNIYRDSNIGYTYTGTVFDSPEDAKSAAQQKIGSYISTIKIEWEE